MDIVVELQLNCNMILQMFVQFIDLICLFNSPNIWQNYFKYLVFEVVLPKFVFSMLDCNRNVSEVLRPSSYFFTFPVALGLARVGWLVGKNWGVCLVCANNGEKPVESSLKSAHNAQKSKKKNYLTHLPAQNLNNSIKLCNNSDLILLPVIFVLFLLFILLLIS